MPLSSYPFSGDGESSRRGGRLTQEQLTTAIRETTGMRVVNGFAEMLDVGDAESACDRVAGFMESHDTREWKLALSASRSLRWRTGPVPQNVGGADADDANDCRVGETKVGETVVFLLSIGFGQGSPLPQPSGCWQVKVNGHEALQIRVVNHSQLWRGAECKLAFSMRRCETAPPYCAMTLSSVITNESQAAFGLGALLVPASWCKAGEPSVVELAPSPETGRPDSTRWVSLNAAPGLVGQSDAVSALAMLEDGWVRKSGEYNLYFGDIHTHSGQVLDSTENKGCGWGSWESNYLFAKGAGGLDFFALTDHEWQIEPGCEEAYFALADAHEVPGQFVCLPAFEHTSLVYGHRNVYFNDRGKLVNTNRALGGHPSLVARDNLTPDELWAELDASGVEYFTVPHHPSSSSHPFSWSLFDANRDRLCEVYSVWGSSDYYGDFPRGVSDRHEGLYIREALARGLRFGIIASSDGHGGTPGDESSPYPKHPHQFHFCGSGRAVVLAKELTRAAVFEALRQRRCYGTTGPPIVLDFRVDGAVMGQELPASATPPRIEVRCAGSNGIDHVRLLRNGEVIHTRHCHGEWETAFEWVDESHCPDSVACYCVRVVQVDRESAWSSPIWVG